MFQDAALEVCKMTKKFQILLLSILFIQIATTAFEITPLNLSFLAFQFSLFTVGYLGAQRHNIRLLRFYVALRVTLWTLNLILLFAFIFFPNFCLHLLAPLLEASHPTEVVAAHVNNYPQFSFWAFVLHQLASFIYSFMIVLSVLMAHRLSCLVRLTEALIPIEVQARLHTDLPQTSNEKEQAPSSPSGYAPLPKSDVELHEHTVILTPPQVPFVPEHLYPQGYILYPALPQQPIQ